MLLFCKYFGGINVRFLYDILRCSESIYKLPKLLGGKFDLRLQYSGLLLNVELVILAVPHTLLYANQFLLSLPSFGNL